MSDTEPGRPDPALAASDGYRFELSGGDAALDFANTISRREEPAESREDLSHYGRLVSWAQQASLLPDKDAATLRADAADRPRAAVAALRRAVALRESIFSIFSTIARGDRPPAEALSVFNAALPGALASLRVAAERGGFGWRFAHPDGDLAPMLAPVARAAANLLTSTDLARVRECGSDTCSWLFLDQSKNGSRRWCDMKVCGNRAKARRHYQRERKSARARRTGDASGGR
jgi:predicted RNA-binding Zn ribbon-like protein